MSDSLGPIDVEFIINSGEVKRDAERVKKELQGVDQEADAIARRVEARVQRTFQFTNEQAQALNSSYNKQAQQQKQSLTEFEQTVRAVSDRYRGLMETGAGAFLELDQETRRLIINLNDAQAELKEVSAAQRDVNQRFDEGEISAKQYSNAIASLSIKEAQLRSNIKSMTTELQAQNGNLRTQARGFDGLGFSIAQVTRELPAFTYSAQTGLMAISNNLPILADQIQRVREQNKQLVASGQQAVPVWQQLVKGLLSWHTALSLGIMILTVYGKEIGEWVAGLFSGGEAAKKARLETEAFHKALQDTKYTGAIENLKKLEISIKAVERGYLSKDQVLSDFNKTIGKTVGVQSTYNGMLQWLIDNKDLYINLIRDQAKAQALLQLSVEKTVAAQEKTLNPSFWSKSTQLLAGFFRNPINPGAGALNNLTDSFEEITRIDQMYEELFSSIQKRMEENDWNFDDVFESQETVRSYETLLSKIEQLDQEYARKNLNRDEAELQALRDKFDAIRKEIEKFNADPKNKVKIDMGLLDGIQEGAEATLTYTQETEFLKQVIEARKQLFTDYEEYKLKFGEEKARERYSGLIRQDQNYAAFLRRMAEENAESYNAIMGGTATGPQAERVRMLDEAIQAESDRRQQAFEESLAQLQSYEQKRKLLIEKFQNERIALQNAGEFEALTELERRQQAELDKLDDDQAKSMEQYKAFYRGLTGLTQEAAASLIEQTRAWLDELVAAGRISQNLADTIRQKLDAALSQNNRRDVRSIRQQSQAYRELAISLVELGESLQHNGLAAAGQILASLSQNMEALSLAFDKEQRDQLDLSQKIAIGVQGLANALNILAQSAARRRAEEERYYLSLIGLQQQYNLSLNEQIRLRSISGENVFMPDHMGRVKDGFAAATDAATKYQRAIGKVAQGQAKIDQKNVVDGKSTAGMALAGAAAGAAFGPIGALIGGGAGLIAGLFGAKKPKDVWGPILRTYPKLIQQTAEGVHELDVALAKALVSQKLVTEETAASLQEAIEWQEALEKAQAQIDEVVKELAGSLGNDLKSALVEAFQAGEDAAMAMGESVEKVLENIIANLLFQEIFKEAFDDLQARMVKSFGSEDVMGNLTQDLGDFFSEAKGLGEQFNEAMKAAQDAAKEVGLNLFTNERERSGGGLQGAIRRELTEQTASELTGLYRATYDLQRRHFDSHVLLLENERKALEATIRIMVHSAAIESNTTAMRAEMEVAVQELKTIVRNTRPGASTRDLSTSR